MKNQFKTVILATISLMLPLAVWGGPFTVTPVRIYMNPADRAVAVTITNDSDKDLVMQADLFVWKQKAGGEDDLTLTDDLLLSPPIIKLGPKARQVVRLARLHPLVQPQQQTYRLVIREIPEAQPNTGNMQLQIAVAFSIPIFITPPNAKSQLDCKATRSAADSINVTCGNNGTAYAQIINMNVSDSNGEKLASRSNGGYILPGIVRSFDVKSENSKPIQAGKAELSVMLDDGSRQTYDVTLPE